MPKRSQKKQPHNITLVIFLGDIIHWSKNEKKSVLLILCILYICCCILIGKKIGQLACNARQMLLFWVGHEPVFNMHKCSAGLMGGKNVLSMYYFKQGSRLTLVSLVRLSFSFRYVQWLQSNDFLSVTLCLSVPIHIGNFISQSVNDCEPE